MSAVVRPIDWRISKVCAERRGGAVSTEAGVFSNFAVRLKMRMSPIPSSFTDWML